jgi:PhoH-like ATPase
MPRTKKSTPANPKIFVLDTSVILYNHTALTSFDAHDVVIPIPVLEELDHFKKGNDIINFEARAFIRTLDNYSEGRPLTDWIPLNGKDKGQFKVALDGETTPDACQVFGEDKPDHRILNAALRLRSEHPDRKVVLVSKDVNLRIKARALDLQAEDFETGKIKHVDTLYDGKTTVEGVSAALIEQIYQEGFAGWKELFKEEPIPHHYFILKNSKSSVLCYYNPLSGLLERVEKTSAFQIKPRNAEQVFALHALMNPEVQLVTIQGVAGTGKTLLALAAALEQRRNFRQIYLARPIVPLSNKDLGYLPGDIKSKLNPYMEPLFDNLKFIQSGFEEKEKDGKKISEMLENEKLVITPLAYIRGRSLSHIFFIVDEAQNLTPHEVKTIITRAGEGTKIIFCGDIYQIDTPYLDAQSNGLSYLIDKMHRHPIHAHITLEKGERSELANVANQLL